MLTELERSKNTHNRLAYFTDITVIISDKIMVRHKFRVDTGSTSTVIGMGILNKEVLNYIYNFGEQLTDRSIVDASGKELKLFRLNIKKFIINEKDNIIINNMELFFSPDIDKNVILGMDILSLFEFKYMHEKNQKVGTFYLINPDKSIQYLYDHCTKKGDVVIPRSVMIIDDKTRNKPRLICTSKEKTGNKITRYTIYDKETDKSRVVTAKELRGILKTHKIGNVTLTSDNKIRTSKSVKLINKEK